MHGAMLRRLQDELGISPATLSKEDFVYLGKIQYHAISSSGEWAEHELDHVYLIRRDLEISPNDEEICDIRWVIPAELDSEIVERPDDFAPWFKVIYRDIIKKNWNKKHILPLDNIVIYSQPLH